MPRWPQPVAPVKRLLTVPEAADYLGRSEGAVRNLMYRREIPFVKHGRTVHLTLEDLDAFIASGRVEATVRAS